MHRMRKTYLALVVMLTLSAAPAQAAIFTWLDYADFQPRLDQLANSAGVTPFSAAETAELSSRLQQGLETIYSPFDITFTTTQPAAPYETIRFGATGAFGLLGEADRIDYRNDAHTDVAQVFTANFGFILDEFTGSTNRSEQLRQIAQALTGTAAHEFGHNLGLMHEDSYGEVAYSGIAGVASTGGQQNQYLMASSQTGLTELQRETERTLNARALVKLEYAAGLLSATPESVVEQTTSHNTLATAQPVAFTPMTVTELEAANIIGNLALGNEIDWYLFEALADTLLSADVISEEIFFDSVDTIISLYGIDGTTLLAKNDDTRFDAALFGVGPLETRDSAFFNVLLPATGTYFLKVESYAGTVGDYELLLTAAVPESIDDGGGGEGGGDNLVHSPEPSSTLLTAALGLTAILAGIRRRRR